MDEQRLVPSELLHFIAYMGISKSNPGLLILDNHRSHLGLNGINIAEENGLSILMFLPIAVIGCNHWTWRSLDRLRHFTAVLQMPWWLQILAVRLAFVKSLNSRGQLFLKHLLLKVSRLLAKATAVFLYNQHIFTEDSFLPSFVTDRLICSSSTDELSNEALSTSCDEELLLSIKPHPKFLAQLLGAQPEDKNQLS